MGVLGLVGDVGWVGAVASVDVASLTSDEMLSVVAGAGVLFSATMLSLIVGMLTCGTGVVGSHDAW